MLDRSGQIIAVAVLFLTLSWIAVALRAFVRIKLLKSIGLDDWLMFAAQLSFTGYIACQLGGVANGTGKDITLLNLPDAMRALRFWYFCDVFYPISTTLMKISVGVFLLRIATNRIHIWILHFLNVASALFGLIITFILAFQCNPAQGFWTRAGDPTASKCLSSDIIVGLMIGLSVINSVMDWTFGILPAFIIWNLKMSKKAKIMVGALLAFAAIGSIASIVRLPYSNTLKDTGNFLYATTDFAIWSTVEGGIGLIAACIATLRPLLQIVLWKLGFSSSEPTFIKVKEGQRRSRPMDSYGYQRSFGSNNPHSKKDGTITTITQAGDDIPGHTMELTGSKEAILGANGINKSIIVDIDYAERGELSKEDHRWRH